LLILHKQTLA